MAQSVSQQFAAALTHLLNQEGRGAQSRLSGQQKIDRGYLNAIVKGRKPGSEAVRSKIAAHFQMTYEEMLSLGRKIIERNDARIPEGMERGGLRAELLKDIVRTGNEVPGNNFSGKDGRIRSNISEKIMKVVEILETDTRYRDVLEELIDTFHESISTRNENLKLRNLMKEMESRIASLENRLASKKDCTRKSA